MSKLPLYRTEWVICIGVFLSLQSLLIYTCTAQPSPQDSIRSNPYYALYQDYLMVSPYMGLSTLELGFMPQGGATEHETRYTSNASYRVGLQLSFNDIAIVAGLGTSLNNFSTSQYEKSKSQDYSFSLISGGRVIKMSYRTSKGLIETTQSAKKLADDLQQKYPYRDELSYQQAHLQWGHFFKPEKFDYNTIVNMAGQHYKSANSFSIRAGYDYFSIKADSSWVPQGQRLIYNSSMEYVNGLQAHSLAIAPGWAGVWAGKHWFIMAHFGLGARLSYLTTHLQGQQNQAGWSLDPDLTSRISFGYNRPRWYFIIDSDSQYFSFESKVYSGNILYTQLYYTLGVRFHSPKLGNFLRQIPVVKWFV